jgi:hypothetical protein
MLLVTLRLISNTQHIPALLAAFWRSDVCSFLYLDVLQLQVLQLPGYLFPGVGVV